MRRLLRVQPTHTRARTHTHTEAGMPTTVRHTAPPAPQLKKDPFPDSGFVTAWSVLSDHKMTVSRVTSTNVSGELKELGVDPTPMEDIAERYLVRFRKSSMFIDEDEIVKQPR